MDTALNRLISAVLACVAMAVFFFIVSSFPPMHPEPIAPPAPSAAPDARHELEAYMRGGDGVYDVTPAGKTGEAPALAAVPADGGSGKAQR